MKDQRVAEDLKAQKNAKLLKEVERLQNELKHSKGLQQETEQLLTEKTKEVTKQTQKAARLIEERGKLSAEVDKLKGALAQKDEDFANEIEAFKLDAAQSYLMGFEAAIEQGSGLHPEIDYSELGPGKIDGQLRGD